MKNILVLIIFFFSLSCGKPKTVLICGNHECVNKNEAEQYFKENLSIEVKIIDDKKKDEIDLIELNLNKDYKKDKKIIVLSRNATNKKLKKLSNKEVLEIKKNLKNKKKIEKIAKKKTQKENKLNRKKIIKEEKTKIDNDKIIKKNMNENVVEVIDVCTILKKCSIDEISKYLLKQSKKKEFPDITKRHK